MNKSFYEKTSPENANINSKRIINFINRLEKEEVDMHSILIMRGNKLICEAYYNPFNSNTLHRMFSVTKSVVSMAIGALAEDGVIDLDASITKYFPEYEPEDGFYPYLIETTIRDMLSMTTPHNGTTFDKHSKNNWTESYFTKKPTHRPGTIFSYDTSASHVMAALVEKLTGLSLLDYLRTKGLTKVGFSNESYCITDGSGVSQGGSGMMAYPKDLLLLAKLAIDYGKIDNIQILPEKYLREATSYKVANFVKGSFLAEMQGYGYQFWMTKNNGFMMYGMAGQLALCFPDKDLILVTTADTTDRKGGVQQIIDAFFDEVYSYIDEENEFDKDSYLKLCEISDNCSLKPLKNNISVELDKTYEFFDDNSLEISNVRIITSVSGGKIILDNTYGSQIIKFGFNSFLDGNFSHYDCPYIASGCWADKNTLVVKANLIGECIGKVIMQFSFKKDGAVTIFSRKTEEILFSEYSGFAQSN